MSSCPYYPSLCRVTLVSQAAEDHRDWTAVTGPEEILEIPALGGDTLAPVDFLYGKTSCFIHLTYFNLTYSNTSNIIFTYRDRDTDVVFASNRG